ncbi:unnamed protein product [Medioppia subpectinata]|uniref:Potassium channel tetramerisation-type BTB domain-containing protein n=1 Tax=Medioppia subpectinata TaxID=1979941 RepID=A0A7R9PXL3_9ACAR|nr:unnamed protein product [Medioppia subpectinata]CAG2104926.1 unnamed protein product [Medioppia subpectinata]
MSAMKKCLSHSYLYQKQSMTAEEEIISLNVGGKRFSTSRQTLTSIGDTFFTALLSGRILTRQLTLHSSAHPLCRSSHLSTDQVMGQQMDRNHNDLKLTAN